jgi:hypothetical protein
MNAKIVGIVTLCDSLCVHPSRFLTCLTLIRNTCELYAGVTSQVLAWVHCGGDHSVHEMRMGKRASIRHPKIRNNSLDQLKYRETKREPSI